MLCRELKPLRPRNKRYIGHTYCLAHPMIQWISDDGHYGRHLSRSEMTKEQRILKKRATTIMNRGYSNRDIHWHTNITGKYNKIKYTNRVRRLH
jgi:hypothetical protein